MAAGTDTHNHGCTFQGAAPNTDNQTHRYPHRMPPKAPDTDNLGTDTLASTPKVQPHFSTDICQAQANFHSLAFAMTRGLKLQRGHSGCILHTHPPPRASRPPPACPCGHRRPPSARTAPSPPPPPAELQARACKACACGEPCSLGLQLRNLVLARACSGLWGLFAPLVRGVRGVRGVWGVGAWGGCRGCRGAGGAGSAGGSGSAGGAESAGGAGSAGGARSAGCAGGHNQQPELRRPTT
jgi:hypothetical protein